jgi:hypothetical protein
MMPDLCPHCGAELPQNAKACPECGSDENTGWSERAQSDGLGLPDEEFEYEDFVKREFGDQGPVPRGLHWFWWLVGITVVGGFVFLLLR